MNIYCVLRFIGPFYKAFCLGLVQFYGKLCPFHFKILSTYASSPMGVRDVTVGFGAKVLQP